MIARHDGQVVLVAGAVPGERVAARVERAERRIAFAAVTRVLEASPDRREGFSDAACGGCAYSHIAYPRQVALEGDIVRADVSSHRPDHARGAGRCGGVS